MINRLLTLINQAGYHLQQAEQDEAHGLQDVRTYNLTKYERDMNKIRTIKELLEV